jgi:hypothetical protein
MPVGAKDTVGEKLGESLAATVGIVEFVGLEVGGEVGEVVVSTNGGAGIGMDGESVGAGAVVGDGVGSGTATVNDTEGAIVVSFCACARTTEGVPARRKIMKRYGHNDIPDRDNVG